MRGDAAEEARAEHGRQRARSSTCRGSIASTALAARGRSATAAPIVTLDNHYVHGGQGEMLAAAIAELGLEPAPRVLRVGVTALPECGTNDEVLAHHRLDVAGLVKQHALTVGPAARIA